MPVPMCWRRVQILRSYCDKYKPEVVCVDISDLGVDQGLYVGRSRAEAVAEAETSSASVTLDIE